MGEDKMLKLSIITTLYNSAGYMPKCLDTLLHQDLSPDEYEIILVNDGSPDNSLDVANEYALKHSNIRVVTYEVNRGLAGARQAGTDVASGEYLCYVDPDDYIAKNSFTPLLDQMEKESLDLLRFDYQVVDDNYDPLPKPKDAQLISYVPSITDGESYLAEKLGYGCFVWAFIYRTSLIKDSGVRFRQGDYFDDTAWLPQIVRRAKRVDVTPAVHYFYLVRSNSLVNTVNAASIRRKLDAQLVVIDRLNDQKESVSGKVLTWYKGMISKTALTCITSAATQLQGEWQRYLNELKTRKVFPLTCRMATPTQRMKLNLLNIAPRIFCKALQSKYSN